MGGVVYFCGLLLAVGALPMEDKSLRSIAERTGEKLENLQEGVNPEELGEYLEGDLIVPSGRNGLVDEKFLWEGGVIPYEIKGSFNAKELDMISKAMDEYHMHTCLRFVPRIDTDKDYMVLNNERSGCWSVVGKQGGPQVVNLQTPACAFKIGTVIHEMMHLAGFTHEQNRNERDDYVNIIWSNIPEKRRINFEKSKEPVSGYGVKYDFDSVMHYSNRSFSMNENGYTIVPKTKEPVNMGQREGFSKKDIQKIRKMYKCQERDETPNIKPTEGSPNSGPNNNGNTGSNNNGNAGNGLAGLVSLIFG